MYLIELNNYNFNINKKNIFKNLSVKIEKNSINYLTGKNSCGKTTFMKILNGKYIYKNIKYNNELLKTNKLKQDTIYINEEIIFYGKTIFEELRLLSDYNNDSFIDKILIDFDLYDKKNKSPLLLNKVDNCKLSIVKSLLLRKKLILIDNIFSFFKTEDAIKTINMIKKYMKKTDSTVIVSSCDSSIIFEFDNIIIIDDNKVIFNNSYIDEEIFNKLGLQMPFICELSNKLNLYELIDEDVYDLDMLVDKL